MYLVVLSMIMTAVLLPLAVMAKALPCRIPYGVRSTGTPIECNLRGRPFWRRKGCSQPEHGILHAYLLFDVHQSKAWPRADLYLHTHTSNVMIHES